MHTKQCSTSGQSREGRERVTEQRRRQTTRENRQKSNKEPDNAEKSKEGRQEKRTKQGEQEETNVGPETDKIKTKRNKSQNGHRHMGNNP